MEETNFRAHHDPFHGSINGCPDGHLAVFRVLADLLDQLLTALLRQLREVQTDIPAVILGIERSVYSVTAIDLEADFVMEPSELMVVTYTCNSLLGGAT